MGNEEDEEFSPDQSDGRVIGDDEFTARVQGMERGGTPHQVTLEEIIGAVCTACGVTREEMVAAGKGRRESEARSMVALVVQEERGITLTEVARVFGRGTSSLTTGAWRLRIRLGGDEEAREHLATVKAELRIPQINT